MIEFMPDTLSVHALKKKLSQHNQPDKLQTMAQFYRWYYGPRFEEAQRNFIRSLAAYSVFCYIFNVKDRHNGNIMLTRFGHILHIDFGFMFQNSPGGFQIGFEQAPFKLTQDYIDLMDGVDSDKFANFKSLVTAGLQEAKKNLDEIEQLITILAKGKSSMRSDALCRQQNALLHE